MGKARAQRRQPVADAAERYDATGGPDRPGEAVSVAGTAEGAGDADLEADIRLRAYERYLMRGDDPGSEVDDWCAAEREVREARRS